MEIKIQGMNNFGIIRPSFFQYISIFIIPMAFFMLVPLGVKLVYVLSLFWMFELLLLFCLWFFLATTTYIIGPDRIEIRSGVMVKRSTTIPFEKIINITCRQTLFQKLFGIGDVFIELPGLEPSEMALTGIEKHQVVAKMIFSMRKRDSV